jgi:di/tricarboxylate transporter
MLDLNLSQSGEGMLALGLVAFMFAMFLTERWPTEVVALATVSLMLILGLLPYEAALEVLSNPAPWTIAAMFIVMGALVRTGALDRFIKAAEGAAKSNPKRAIAMLLVFVAIASAFVNNTPVVVVMIPVFVQLARHRGADAVEIPDPAELRAIMGGTLTLIGTSTNLLVDGSRAPAGSNPSRSSRSRRLGIIVVAWGMIYLFFVGRYLLPERTSWRALLTGRRAEPGEVLHRGRGARDSTLIGATSTRWSCSSATACA